MWYDTNLQRDTYLNVPSHQKFVFQAYYQANGAIMDHLKTQGITNVTIEPKIEKILKPV